MFLDIAVVNIALPEIQRGLGFSEAKLSWVVNAYQILFGGFLLLGGRASDLLGQRRIFLSGLAVFTAASLLAGLAWSPEALVVARLLQGLGAAFVVPAGLALISTVFSGTGDYDRAFGVWGAMRAAGASSGVALGGILTQFLGWPSIFLINVPIGILILLLGPLFLPEFRAGEQASFDLAGAATATGGLLLAVYGLVEMPQAGWSSIRTFGLLSLAIALLVIFVLVESRSQDPLVPLDVFRLRNLSGASATSLLVGASHVPMFFFLSLYLQQVLGYGALQAGLAALPIGLVNLTVSTLLMPKVLRRFGPKTPLVAGLALLASGLVLFARLPLEAGYLRDVFPASMVVAFGLSGAFIGVTLPAIEAVGPARKGLASGLVNATQRIGSALGVGVLATVAASVTGDPGGSAEATFASGLRAGFAGAAFFALVGATISMVMIRGRSKHSSPTPPSAKK